MSKDLWFTVVSQDFLGNMWILSCHSTNIPEQVYVYNRANREVKKICDTKEALATHVLQATEPITIKSQDGLDLLCYVTYPSSNAPYPAVIWSHGGPNSCRDSWGFNNYHKWFSDRGYAVLSVNYRGSPGFGKEFMSKGEGEWGGKMHQDLIDATQYLIKGGKIDETKVCIAGGCYAGYTTLAALIHTPKYFACGISITAPVDLMYFALRWPGIKKFVGDPTTAEGQAAISAKSLHDKTEGIHKPVLLLHTTGDPVVPVSQTRTIVDTIKGLNPNVSYLEFNSVGHGFITPDGLEISLYMMEVFKVIISEV